MGSHVVYPSFDHPNKACELPIVDQGDSKLMTLPRELRDKILRVLLKDNEPVEAFYKVKDKEQAVPGHVSDGGVETCKDRNPFEIQILAVCQQMYEEGCSVFYGENRLSISCRLRAHEDMGWGILEYVTLEAFGQDLLNYSNNLTQLILEYSQNSYKFVLNTPPAAFKQFQHIELTLDPSHIDKSIYNMPRDFAKTGPSRIACLFLKEYLDGKDLVIHPSYSDTTYCVDCYGGASEQCPAGLKAKDLLCFRSLRCPSFKIQSDGYCFDDVGILEAIEATVKSDHVVPNLLSRAQEFLRPFQDAVPISRLCVGWLPLHDIAEAALNLEQKVFETEMQRAIGVARGWIKQGLEDARKRLEDLKKGDEQMIELAGEMGLNAVPIIDGQ